MNLLCHHENDENQTNQKKTNKSMLIIAFRLIGKYVLEHAFPSAFRLHRLKSKRQPLQAHASFVQHEKTSDKSLCMIAMLAKKGAMKESPS